MDTLSPAGSALESAYGTGWSAAERNEGAAQGGSQRGRSRRRQSVVEAERERTDMDQGVVAPIDGRILVADDGADFIDPGLIGKVDGEQLRFQPADAQVAASHQSEERTVRVAGQPDPGRRNVGVGRRHSRVEGAIGKLRLLVH